MMFKYYVDDKMYSTVDCYKYPVYLFIHPGKSDELGVHYI